MAGGDLASCPAQGVEGDRDAIDERQARKRVLELLAQPRARWSTRSGMSERVVVPVRLDRVDVEL